MKRGRSTSAPSYRLHKATGQARVTINGKTYYLGKHGTEESQQKYKQALADHWNPPGTAPKPVPRQSESSITVAHLAIEYAKHVKTKHGDDSNEWKQVRLVLKEIRATYGPLNAAEFGPIRFENYRQSLIDRGLSRGVIKRKSNYVLKMFQQGVKFELIPETMWQRLLSVGPVEMKTKPKRKRGAVSLDVIKKTQKELTPVLSDMVEVHRLIGARPTEMCMMRPCDIDRSGDVWVYVPASHKTEHHGHSLRIAIGPQAQAALARYLCAWSDVSFNGQAAQEFSDTWFGKFFNRSVFKKLAESLEPIQVCPFGIQRIALKSQQPLHFSQWFGQVFVQVSSDQFAMLGVGGQIGRTRILTSNLSKRGNDILQNRWLHSKNVPLIAINGLNCLQALPCRNLSIP